MNKFSIITDKLKLSLVPFVIVGAIFTTILLSIITLIKDFIIDNSKELLLILASAVFVVPIVVSLITGWEIPGIIIFYDFMYGLIVLIMLANLADDRQDGRRGYYQNDRQYYSDYNKTYGYNRSFYFDPLNTEKRRNGGLTDKEVAEKKKLIRKKLEKIDE